MLCRRDIPCFIVSVMLSRGDIPCFVASEMRYRCDIPCFVPFVMHYRRYIPYFVPSVMHYRRYIPYFVPVMRYRCDITYPCRVSDPHPLSFISIVGQNYAKSAEKANFAILRCCKWALWKK